MTLPIDGANDWMIFVLGLTTGALARPDIRQAGIEIVDVSLPTLSFCVETPGGRLRISVQPAIPV